VPDAAIRHSDFGFDSSFATSDFVIFPVASAVSLSNARFAFARRPVGHSLGDGPSLGEGGPPTPNGACLPSGFVPARRDYAVTSRLAAKRDGTRSLPFRRLFRVPHSAFRVAHPFVPSSRSLP